MDLPMEHIIEKVSLDPYTEDVTVLTTETKPENQNKQENIDPSLLDGYHVIYDKEIPFEVRIQEASSKDLSSGAEAVSNASSTSFDYSSYGVNKHTFIENLKVKILVVGHSTDPTSYKIELSSENNLFFHYHSVCTSHEFPALQYEQKLMVEFSDYSTVLTRLFNSCLNEPSKHIALLLIKEAREGGSEEERQEESHTLIFIKNMEYKLMDLLTLKFNKTKNSLLQHHVVYRYYLMKKQMLQMQEHLNDIYQVIKLKNPSLLLQIQKTSSKNEMRHLPLSSAASSPLSIGHSSSNSVMSTKSFKR